MERGSVFLPILLLDSFEINPFSVACVRVSVCLYCANCDTFDFEHKREVVLFSREKHTAFDVLKSNVMA